MSDVVLATDACVITRFRFPTHDCHESGKDRGLQAAWCMRVGVQRLHGVCEWVCRGGRLQGVFEWVCRGRGWRLYRSVMSS